MDFKVIEHTFAGGDEVEDSADRMKQVAFPDFLPNFFSNFQVTPARPPVTNHGREEMKKEVPASPTFQTLQWTTFSAEEMEQVTRGGGEYEEWDQEDVRMEMEVDTSRAYSSGISDTDDDNGAFSGKEVDIAVNQKYLDSHSGNTGDDEDEDSDKPTFHNKSQRTKKRMVTMELMDHDLSKIREKARVTVRKRAYQNQPGGEREFYNVQEMAKRNKKLEKENQILRKKVHSLERIMTWMKTPN